MRKSCIFFKSTSIAGWCHWTASGCAVYSFCLLCGAFRGNESVPPAPMSQRWAAWPPGAWFISHHYPISAPLSRLSSFRPRLSYHSYVSLDGAADWRSCWRTDGGWCLWQFYLRTFNSIPWEEKGRMESRLLYIINGWQQSCRWTAPLALTRQL